ncbi:MAG: NADH-quinone oxidoreductase subunit J [Metallibacterium scheffleri]|jgi:NADH-quinone oxidoreductase subunit J|uniref:NADH-quinone oxidoreductase subunit J n=1 Tax=Metallibacterium scheffleri TaxID=993689 RepID=UPI0026ECBC8F|nr:NADH-quinone oxidoreductase subunit J [Metallibacterium scheffleri]MCK9365570.1 NADH-quinone oxidoreductase subunit J [Metallibacterium scheffleri]
MTIQLLAFYFFALFAVLGALLVISLRNPVHAVLSLVLTFFSVACVWMLLDAEFLALALIVVYVGAVMVLFLFVVMMLDIKVAAARDGFIRYLPVGIGVALIMLAEMIAMIGVRAMQVAPPPNPATMHGESNVAWIGQALYTHYLLPFEVAAVILTVGIVAAVALTLRQRTGVRHQSAAQQVAVVARDRVRLVSMPAERGDDGAKS